MGCKRIDLSARTNRMSMGGGDTKKHYIRKGTFDSAFLVVEKCIEGKSMGGMVS